MTVVNLEPEDAPAMVGEETGGDDYTLNEAHSPRAPSTRAWNPRGPGRPRQFPAEPLSNSCNPATRNHLRGASARARMGPLAPSPTDRATRRRRDTGPGDKIVKENSFVGNWRILETELWEAEDLDLLAPASIVLDRNHDGHMGLIAIGAEIDYRVVVRDGQPAIEFSFDGFDEDRRIAGRGWAVCDGEQLRGRLFFHQGDETSFVARRNGRRRASASKG